MLLRLVGRSSNRFGIGATVRLETTDGSQVKTLHPTAGYMSANEPLVHFGLGDVESIERLTVHWPGGRRQTFEELATGRLYTVTEPDGPYSPAAR